MDLSPYFDGNKLGVTLTLKKSLINNPIYMLEVMTRLQGFFTNPEKRSFGILTENKHVSASHHYEIIDGKVVYNHHKTVYEHYTYETIHSVFETLGIILPPTYRQSGPLGFTEMVVNRSAGQRLCATRYFKR